MSDDVDYYNGVGYDRYDYGEYVEVDLSEVVFEEFSVRIDLDEYEQFEQFEQFKLFRKFECMRNLDDKNFRLNPTYIDYFY